MEGPQPGQTIAPQSQDDHRAPEAPAKVDPSPTVAQAVVRSEPHDPEPEAGFFRRTNETPEAAKSSNTQSDRAQASGDNDNVRWTASEFIEHSKSINWYVSLAIGAILLAGVDFVATHDKISTIVILVAALALGIFAARKPRVLEYRLDDAGLTIGGKFYGYELFKSFSIVNEGAVPSIYLVPLRRLVPPLSLYFAQADEEKIVNILAERLPLEERHFDGVDRFVHRIRF